MTTLPANVTMHDMQTMAVALSKSGMFGYDNPEQAMALMMIAQAEGRHPAFVARDYHIIKGKPALKADAMLARFQQVGGKVEWKEYTDTRVVGVFTHPSGGTAIIDWDILRAQKAELGSNGMWKKYPRQMLRSRVIGEGIRTIYPGIIVGLYTEEEVYDLDDVTQKSDNFIDATIDIEDEPKRLTHQWLSSVKAHLKTIEDFNSFDNYVMENMKEIEEAVFISKSHPLSDEQIKWLNDQLESTRTRLYKEALKNIEPKLTNPETVETQEVIG